MQLNEKSEEKTLGNAKSIVKQAKKISKSKEVKEIGINIEENENSKEKPTIKTNENDEIAFLDKNDEIEPTEEINNARKKRRRSSASIEESI